MLDKNKKIEKLENNHQNVPLNILSQGIKHCKFKSYCSDLLKENINNGELSSDIDLNIHKKKYDDNMYDIILYMKMFFYIGDKKAAMDFDMSYGMVVEVNENIDDKDIDILTDIECPRLVFPFIRSFIVNLTQDSGFPPIVLSPIDFVKLYFSKKKNSGERNEKQA